MQLLTFLLSLWLSAAPAGEPVTVEFTFREMRPGKPPLKMFYYDVSVRNNSGKLKYVAIPRRFDEKLIPEDKVWGAQYDTFGKLKGATLFSGTSFTVFVLQPKEEIRLSPFLIEVMSDDIQQDEKTEIPIRSADDLTVGGKPLSDFMADEDIQNDDLPYSFINSRVTDVQVPLK